MMGFIQMIGKELAVVTRSPDPNADADTNIDEFVAKTYDSIVAPATTELLEFISTLGAEIPTLCITYVDEADELGALIWILCRLASRQSTSIAMWYVFMATKSRVSYFHPDPKKSE